MPGANKAKDSTPKARNQPLAAPTEDVAEADAPRPVRRKNGKGKAKPVAKARGNGKSAGAKGGNGKSAPGRAGNGKATNGKSESGKSANGKSGNGRAAPSQAAADTGAHTRRGPRRLPVVDDAGRAAAGPLPRRRSTGSGLDLQLQLAGFLRVVDRVVSAMVNAYDSIFVVDKKDQGEICFDAGLRFAAEGRVPEAMEALRKASHLLPDDPAPLIELGAMHLRRGAPTAAIQALEKARELGNAESRTHSLLADAYLEEDRVADAVRELEAAFASHVDDPELAYRLGLALDRHGNHTEAVEAFALAVELEPDEIRYLQSLGFAHESLGQREEAVECFKRALELEHREDTAAQ